MLLTQLAQGLASIAPTVPFLLHTLAGQQQQYVLTNNGLLEVNRVRHAASSWLVDQAFVSGRCAVRLRAKQFGVSLRVIAGIKTPTNAVYGLCESKA